MICQFCIIIIEFKPSAAGDEQHAPPTMLVLIGKGGIIIMSQWDDLQMDVKISGILNVQPLDPTHHFGRPFLTPYQIAISFQERHPQDFQVIGKPVGGKGTGQQDSLAQYIALELSKRIKDTRITNIEGRFLYRGSLTSLQYTNNGQTIKSSSMQSYDLSMFRLIG